MDDGNRPVNTTSPLRSTPDDAIDRAVREALDVAPSADFVARVRARIASEPAPRGVFGAWLTWKPIAACASATAIALAVWLGRPAPQVRLKADPTPDTTETPTVRLKPDTTYDQGTVDPGTYVVSAFRRTVVASRKEPEILISASESAALRRLIARASEGLIVVNDPTPPASELGGELKPLPEIEPLKIDPIVPVNGEEGVRQ
jgi:hypothetical protein